MAELRITDLTIEYSSGGYIVRPIDKLTVTAEPGSLVLLLGPSGCGKTSLLSCLGGILRPKSGSITFGEIDVTKLTGRALTTYRRETVGIVFQAFNLVPSLTAVENVTVPLRSAGHRWRPARDRAVSLLEQVGLADRLHHRPGDLSGGQQQRVAIARALAMDPPLILADEPTAHLDYVQVEEVLRVLRSLASGERVVVVATHDSRLLPLADQVLELVPHMARSSRPPERVELAAGAELFHQGDWGELIYVVESGELEMVVERDDGTEERKAVTTAGRHFGEIGPLFGMPRSASARAITDAVVVGYTTHDFRRRAGSQGNVVTAEAEMSVASPEPSSEPSVG